MTTLAAGLSYVDLQFLTVPHIIATVVLHDIHHRGGVALIDPGPSSTLPVLRRELDRAGIAMSDVDALVLTHIHLDHAGASGTLVHEHPRLRVYVHEHGAPHMIDPAKLLASAARLYGNDMDRLWGEFRPVPADAIVALRGGERIRAGGRDLDVAYTPGHASHHVSYFARDAGVAFVGDTAGIRLPPGGYILPPTPPPDIDLDVWPKSLATIDEWRPDTVFLTHFGPWGPVGPHLREFADHLEVASRLVRASLAREGTDADREAWFTEEIRRELRRRANGTEAHAYEVAGRFDLSWRGLARYWRKKLASP
jgi:glyoxylase-like metal-dependent hydrolase (beta-lactamase superfamily II)